MSYYIKGQTGKAIGPSLQLLADLNFDSTSLTLASMEDDILEWTASTINATGSGTTLPSNGQVVELLMHLSQRLFELIDHVPARLTAFGFAVVGNFEEAVNGWRRDAGLWLHDNEGILLAAAAGAIGVQLGGQAAPGITPDRSKTFDRGSDADAAGAVGSTPGMPPQTGHLQSVVGLVWRSVVLWLLLAALLSLANLLG